MAKQQRERLSPEETEQIRRRIWLYKARGMRTSRIAAILNRKPSFVYYHLRKARQNAYQYYQGAGEEEIVGDQILVHQEIRKEAFRNLAKTDPVSSNRLEWLKEARQTLKMERDLLFDLGLLQKAPERVDVSVADVRKMSVDEIQREMMRLKRELAFGQVRGITVPDIPDIPGEEDDVIDVVPSGNGGNGDSNKLIEMQDQDQDRPDIDAELSSEDEFAFFDE